MLRNAEKNIGMLRNKFNAHIPIGKKCKYVEMSLWFVQPFFYMATKSNSELIWSNCRFVKKNKPKLHTI